MRGNWSKVQILRVQSAHYAKQHAAEIRAKRAARFSRNREERRRADRNEIMAELRLRRFMEV